MKLSKYAEMIYKDMTYQYSRCIIRLEKGELFKAGLDVYNIGSYRTSIKKSYDMEYITNDDVLHLIEVLDCYLSRISKTIEMEVNEQC